jgi:hypothetical protein
LKSTRGGAAYVKELPGVLLDVNPTDAHPLRPLRRVDLQIAVQTEGVIIHGALILGGEVRVEIVLPVEQAVFGDLAVQGQAGEDGPLDGPLVGDGERPGHPGADRADVAVRLRRGAVHHRARAEHLGAGLQLRVDLQADHRLELHRSPP